MKYLQVRELQNVTSALNFNTTDLHVTGGCDLYITKAATNDRKLYKDIENSLESQHKSLLRLSASLSPPTAEMVNLDLARSSPFGPLSQVSSRRTFAYLIATLNASHPDYDFSHILRPTDFKRERTLREVMSTVDEAIYNSRPRPAAALLANPTPPKALKNHPISPPLGAATQTWGPKSWKAIDKEMTLTECDIYSYVPENDPFDDEETALWSHHYFFFSRERKRVCYLYIRGFSMLSHSPVLSAKRPRSLGVALRDNGATKRAKFWFGERAGQVQQEGDDFMAGSSDLIAQPGDTEVEVDETLEGSDGSIAGYSGGSEDEYLDNGDVDEIEEAMRSKGGVRRMSEHIAETMDL